MDFKKYAAALGGLWLGLGCLPAPAHGCPFCSSVSQTLTQEMAAMDLVVIAHLEEAPRTEANPQGPPDRVLTQAKFKVAQVLKGPSWVPSTGVIQVAYYGDASPGQAFLLMASSPPNLIWSTPLRLSDRAQEYVVQLGKLPADLSRLEFIQLYLEDSDPLLAGDAYDEFAKTPYAGIRALKEKMNHAQLVAWIKDTEVPASRRRLYLTMLGVCGKGEDAAMLEQMLRSDDRKLKAGLDAMIACYLTLSGPAGVPVVEELFLKNPTAEYADTYAAIMALRFHGTDENKIPRQRLVEALRHMLDKPELADLVIPDLARWEDWSVMPRLVELFKSADDKSSWVRVPVINFLRACPLPEAGQQLDELARIDPEAHKRAMTFLPPGTAPADGSQGSAQDGSGSQAPEPAQPDAAAGSPALPQPEAADYPAGEAPGTIRPAAPVVAPDAESGDGPKASGSGAAAGAEQPPGPTDQQGDAAGSPPTGGADAAGTVPPPAPTGRATPQSEAAAATAPDPVPGVGTVLGLPLLGGLVLTLVFWWILRGGAGRQAAA